MRKVVAEQVDGKRVMLAKHTGGYIEVLTDCEVREVFLSLALRPDQAIRLGNALRVYAQTGEVRDA